MNLSEFDALLNWPDSAWPERRLRRPFRRGWYYLPTFARKQGYVKGETARYVTTGRPRALGFLERHGYDVGH